jgi:hypothetical protein
MGTAVVSVIALRLGWPGDGECGNARRGLTLSATAPLLAPGAVADALLKLSQPLHVSFGISDRFNGNEGNHSLAEAVWQCVRFPSPQTPLH